MSKANYKTSDALTHINGDDLEIRENGVIRGDLTVLGTFTASVVVGVDAATLQGATWAAPLPIGEGFGASPTTATFTTLTSSTYDGVIGAITPSAGTFTTLTTSAVSTSLSINSTNVFATEMATFLIPGLPYGNMAYHTIGKASSINQGGYMGFVPSATTALNAVRIGVHGYTSNYIEVLPTGLTVYGDLIVTGSSTVPTTTSNIVITNPATTIDLQIVNSYSGVGHVHIQAFSPNAPNASYVSNQFGVAFGARNQWSQNFYYSASGSFVNHVDTHLDSGGYEHRLYSDYVEHVHNNTTSDRTVSYTTAYQMASGYKIERQFGRNSDTEGNTFIENFYYDNNDSGGNYYRMGIYGAAKTKLFMYRDAVYIEGKANNKPLQVTSTRTGYTEIGSFYIPSLAAGQIVWITVGKSSALYEGAFLGYEPNATAANSKLILSVTGASTRMTMTATHTQIETTFTVSTTAASQTSWFLSPTQHSIDFGYGSGGGQFGYLTYAGSLLSIGVGGSVASLQVASAGGSVTVKTDLFISTGAAWPLYVSTSNAAGRSHFYSTGGNHFIQVGGGTGANAHVYFGQSTNGVGEIGVGGSPTLINFTTSLITFNQPLTVTTSSTVVLSCTSTGTNGIADFFSNSDWNFRFGKSATGAQHAYLSFGLTGATIYLGVGGTAATLTCSATAATITQPLTLSKTIQLGPSVGNAANLILDTGNNFFDGGNLIVGYNHPRLTLHDAVFQVYNNSTDRNVLINCESEGSIGNGDRCMYRGNTTGTRNDFPYGNSTAGAIGEMIGGQRINTNTIAYYDYTITAMGWSGAFVQVAGLVLNKGVYLVSAIANIRTALTQIRTRLSDGSGVFFPSAPSYLSYDAPTGAGYFTITIPPVSVVVRNNSVNIGFDVCQTLVSPITHESYYLSAVRVG